MKDQGVLHVSRDSNCGAITGPAILSTLVGGWSYMSTHKCGRDLPLPPFAAREVGGGRAEGATGCKALFRQAWGWAGGGG